MKTPEERFWEKVNRRGPIHPSLGECWEWVGGRLQDGYGSAFDGTRTMRAHRLAWIYLFGQIPDDLHVLHACDFPLCVRHLFLGTNAENQADKLRKGRQAKGIKNGSSKLTPEKVDQAFLLLASGTSKREIARRFGVNDRTIRHALAGDTWALGSQEARFGA